MNERIKALLLNARNMFVNGVTESNNKIYIHGSEENLEKFAELIVRECMACSTWVGKVNNYAIEPVHTAHTINQRMKEHFGVEE